jgi:starch synthase
MKILMATSEFSPFANTGQLGNEVQILASELKKLGHDVSVAMPFYRSIRESNYDVKLTGIEFKVGLGGKRTSAEVLETTGSDQVQVFLIQRDEYFDRSGIYGTDGRAYEDNSERFIFFAKAVIELAQHLPSAPELIHSHDWPVALIPVFVRDGELPFRTVLTAHNLEYQGSFWSFDFVLTGLRSSYFDPKGVEFYGRLNFLKGGILFADAITLPGEPALFQALSLRHGFGLDGVLAKNRNRTFGIPHGIDYSTLTPPCEKLETKRPRVEYRDGNQASRFALLERLGLSKEIRGPVFVLPIEPGDDEAFEQVSPIFDLLLVDDTCLIVTGQIPESGIGAMIVEERKYPTRFAFLRNRNANLAPLALSASDLVLLPSSLGFRSTTVLTALRYGTLPIVRDRGGLRQFVSDFDPVTETGSGFVYIGSTTGALWDSVRRAKHYYAQPKIWAKLVDQAKILDFSRAESAKAFAKLYSSLLRHREATHIP